MSDYETTHVPEDDAVVYRERDDETSGGAVPERDIVRRVVSCQCADCLFQKLIDDDEDPEDVARDHLDDVGPDPEGSHVIDILSSPKTEFN